MFFSKIPINYGKTWIDKKSLPSIRGKGFFYLRQVTY